jgi:hypothetical protein
MEELAKKYGPIMYLRLGYLNYIVISNVEMAFTVLMIHDADFAFRPLPIIGKYVAFEYSNIIFSPYGDKWHLLQNFSHKQGSRLLNQRIKKRWHVWWRTFLDTTKKGNS